MKVAGSLLRAFVPASVPSAAAAPQPDPDDAQATQASMNAAEEQEQKFEQWVNMVAQFAADMQTINPFHNHALFVVG